MADRPLRLVLFDWDGTLVDSLGTIAISMARAFASHDLPSPTRADMRELVGLRLDEIVRLLHPTGPAEEQADVVESYRREFNLMMADPELPEELFPGVREGLAQLNENGFLQGIATGKSLRGLRTALERYGVAHHFLSLQTPDENPGKPNPGMLLRAMDELGGLPENTVMVGDTRFDMHMATNAGVTPIGVSWGNHSPSELADAGALVVLERFEELNDYLALTD